MQFALGSLLHLSSPGLCAALPMPGSTDLRHSIDAIPSKHNTHEYSIIN